MFRLHAPLYLFIIFFLTIYVVHLFLYAHFIRPLIKQRFHDTTQPFYSPKISFPIFHTLCLFAALNTCIFIYQALYQQINVNYHQYLDAPFITPVYILGILLMYLFYPYVKNKYFLLGGLLFLAFSLLLYQSISVSFWSGIVLSIVLTLFSSLIDSFWCTTISELVQFCKNPVLFIILGLVINIPFLFVFKKCSLFLIETSPENEFFYSFALGILFLAVAFIPSIYDSLHKKIAEKQKISVSTAISIDESYLLQVAQQYQLTKRETDILLSLVTVKSGNRLAEELGISVNTLKTHTKHIYSKLNIHSKEELLDFLTRNLT